MKKRLFKREIRLALEAMAKGKAPGPNGIIVEFFLSMWLVIGREYTKMIIHDAILNDYFPHNFTRVLMQVISQDQSAFLPFSEMHIRMMKVFIHGASVSNSGEWKSLQGLCDRKRGVAGMHVGPLFVPNSGGGQC
ncbi:unnamed protein product [Sphagnum jensenii]|uniref:Uncharacterized protein n=1 Tax=Sphagnum jensenii TaxID=128206 RepID=A0ABP1A576_9BRYO